jgi:hypothetical protein
LLPSDNDIDRSKPRVRPISLELMHNPFSKPAKGKKGKKGKKK